MVGSKDSFTGTGVKADFTMKNQHTNQPVEK